VNRRAAVALGLVAAAATACGPFAAPSSDRFQPTRFDYGAFRKPRAPDEIQEPNYLPFMAGRYAEKGSKEDLLVFCRWDVARFPLAVHVDSPKVDASLADEFDAQKAPQTFVDAAWSALDEWQHALGGLVSFRRVAGNEHADLRIKLIGQVGPAPEAGIQVLGTTPMRDACKIKGRSVWQDRVDVAFDVPEIRIYVADDHGLLPADQVQRNVLHEIGHALGMQGHSPIPADLMYEVARDRRVDRLSIEDVNSFKALYREPNGTIYARLPRGQDLQRDVAHAPAGPPELSPTPFTDARHGYALRPAQGWQVIPSARGVVVIDGLAWDYEASFQVIVRSYPSVTRYLDRHGDAHIRGGKVVQRGFLSVAGRQASWMRIVPPDGEMIEDHVFLESGDGRVVIAILEAPKALRQDFGPWFDAMLGSLQVFQVSVPEVTAPAAQ